MHSVLAGLCLGCLLPVRYAGAVMLECIYRGESVVDFQIYNDLAADWKKFVLKRSDEPVQDWTTQTEADLYFSDTVAAFSRQSYTLLSYSSTDGVSWFGSETDTADVDASAMAGTIHNSLDWQAALGRSAVAWLDQTGGYAVFFVNVADGNLDISNTTLWLDDGAHYLKAIGPGTITAAEVTFASATAAGGWVEFASQSDPAVNPIDNCDFQSVDLRLVSSAGVTIANSAFNNCQVTSDSDSSGTLFEQCSGSYDLSLQGDGETVRDCSGILELYLSGTSHSVLGNSVRNIEARGDTCAIRGNAFSNETCPANRCDIYGNYNQVRENTFDHWVPDGSGMIRILGNGNTVEANFITEWAPEGAWPHGIYIQNGADNTVQLNRIIGYSGNTYGMILDGAHGNLVKKNTIQNCQNGISLGFPNPAGENNFENNAISSTSGAAVDVGPGCDGNAFAFNYIWDGSTGIYVSGDGNGFHENVISGCSYRGIELYADATNTWVYNNVFRGNNVHAVDGGTGNNWNKPKVLVNCNIVGGPYLGGNYWDDYTGPDADGDKLGDVPRPIGGAASAADQLPLIYVSMGTNRIDSGDFNGDGTADIAVFREAAVMWSVRDLTRAYFGATGDLPVAADYDGDGSADIAVFRPSSGMWSVRGLSRFYLGGGNDWLVPGDYDGDGTAEAGIFREASGLWSIRGATRAYLGSTGDAAIPGRYDSDAGKDLAIFRGSSGLWSVRNVTRFYFGASTDDLVPGDYNGEGKWEGGIYRSSSGLWSIRNVTRAYWGNANDAPLPADYDGNGADDIGIFRDSSGMWTVRNLTRVYFGSTDDIPVVR